MKKRRRSVLPREPILKPYQIVLLTFILLLFTVKFIVPLFKRGPKVRPGEIWTIKIKAIPYIDNREQPEVIVNRPCTVLQVKEENEVIYLQYGDTMQLDLANFLYFATKTTNN